MLLAGLSALLGGHGAAHSEPAAGMASIPNDDPVVFTPASDAAGADGSLYAAIDGRETPPRLLIHADHLLAWQGRDYWIWSWPALTLQAHRRHRAPIEALYAGDETVVWLGDARGDGYRLPLRAPYAPVSGDLPPGLRAPDPSTSPDAPEGLSGGRLSAPCPPWRGTVVAHSPEHPWQLLREMPFAPSWGGSRLMAHRLGTAQWQPLQTAHARVWRVAFGDRFLYFAGYYDAVHDPEDPSEPCVSESRSVVVALDLERLESEIVRQGPRVYRLVADQDRLIIEHHEATEVYRAVVTGMQPLRRIERGCSACSPSISTDARYVLTTGTEVALHAVIDGSRWTLDPPDSLEHAELHEVLRSKTSSAPPEPLGCPGELEADGACPVSKSWLLAQLAGIDWDGADRTEARLDALADRAIHPELTAVCRTLAMHGTRMGCDMAEQPRSGLLALARRAGVLLFDLAEDRRWGEVHYYLDTGWLLIRDEGYAAEDPARIERYRWLP